MTNLAVYVAVGRKTIKVNRKVYLNLKISKFQLEYSFLVVSGLSADLIMGADLLKAIGGIINFQNETFEMRGEILPKNIVTFRAVINIENRVESGCYGLKICEQRYIEGNDAQTVNLEIGGETDSSMIMKNDFSPTCIINMLSISDDVASKNIGYDDRILTELNDAEKIQVKDLLYKHKDVFSEEPGCTMVYEHEIRVTVQKPFVKKSYPVPLHQQAAVDKEIEKMFGQGIIQRSCSEFCNPIRVVKKKNGEVRVCLDARWLNKIIADDNESPPTNRGTLTKT